MNEQDIRQEYRVYAAATDLLGPYYGSCNGVKVKGPT